MGEDEIDYMRGQNHQRSPMPVADSQYILDGESPAGGNGINSVLRPDVFHLIFLEIGSMKVPSFVLLTLVAGGLALAADESPVFETPEAARADADFALQGEYTGEALGVQVVALGDGQFSVVTYRGGLPGAGWDGKEKQTGDYDREEVKDLIASWKKIDRVSPTMGAKPAAGAVVLFDGSQQSIDKHWKPGARRTDEGLLAQGCTSLETFGDFTLHLEFRLPFMPAARGQGRGNSGVYYQGRYETQVLDSFGLEGKDNECGGIYSIQAPALNLCLPPLAWQTYDADFTAARFDEQGKKVANARLSVRLNGVFVQQNIELPHATTAAPLGEGPEPGPIYLQDHGNPVRYRNIWVLPRDVDREARRPIVPGFERFFATAGADGVAGGRLLLSELNCTGCHQPEAGLAAHLIKRQPPVLDGIASRMSPEHALTFIADPHGTKPGTPMPDVFAGVAVEDRQAAVRALVSFLFASGRPREQSGNRQFAKNGQQLFHQIGCVACHEPRSGPPVAANQSVPLGGIKSKYTIASLTEFLKNPHQARPSRRMPSFNLTNDEARDLACYLMGDVDVRPRNLNLRFAAYEGSWNTVPDFGKLKPYKQGEAAGLDLTVADRTNNFGVRFEGFLKIDRDGRYRFDIGSDDGSVLFIDGQKVADSDGVHPHQVKSGTAELKQGLHPVRVDYIQGGGEWTLDLEIEGPGLPRQSAETRFQLTQTPAPAVSPKAEHSDDFVFDPSLVEQGQKMFGDLGCSACHDVKSAGRSAQPLVAKPLKECDPAKGCLATAAARPAPDFGLTSVQRDTLATALRAPTPAAPPSPQEKIAAAMTTFNCYACHSRDGRGGPTADRNPHFFTTIPEMGDEGRVPPPLDGVGDKLQEGWLKHVLEQGAKDRPYMLTRMPKFGAAEVVGLAGAFKEADQRNEAPPPELAETTSRVKSTGRFLAGDKALACIKCHTFGEHRATGIQAINLQTMTGRIRQDWFQRYLPDPPKYRPGTRMPSGFVGGHSTIKNVYDGDPARQIAALWTYLSDGSKAGIPEGLITDVIELKPETRPIVYRNFIDGLSPRGIAVGYPEKTNLAWDANNLCLTLVWHGRFIDASKHWTGRGNGFQTPLGDHVTRLEQTVAVSALDSLDEPWPNQPPKDRGYRFRGYRLDTQGRPTFRYIGPAFAVDDYALPVAGNDEGHFERRLTVQAAGEARQLYFLAGAGEIKTLDAGQFLIDGAVNIRLNAQGATPLVRQNGGRQELLVPVVFEQGKAEIVQEIRW
jgi:cytochrome c2